MGKQKEGVRPEGKDPAVGGPGQSRTHSTRDAASAIGVQSALQGHVALPPLQLLLLLPIKNDEEARAWAKPLMPRATPPL